MIQNTIRDLKEIRDTRSLARFGITSLQVRLASGTDHWESDFLVNGRRYSLQGFADAKLGRPRGVDTDVITGIEALFSLREFPEDNVIVTSGYELAQAAHMPDNGKTYRRIREALMRYWRVGFIVREGFEHPDGKGASFYNETFGFFQKVSFWEEASKIAEEMDRIQLSREKTLRIVLTPEFADSLRSGYIHRLDRSLLSRLEQPPARALYRLLSAHRQCNDGSAMDELTVDLMDWREACGIQDERPSKVMRVLETAHDELVAQGYINEVQIEGRGQSTRLTYNFRQTDDPDPALVHLLLEAELGISPLVAREWAAAYPHRVEIALKFVRERVKTGGVRNPAGLLKRVLEDEQRYPLSVNPQPELLAPQKTLQSESEHAALEAEWQENMHARYEHQKSLPAGEQWKAVESVLKLLLKKHLSDEQWRRLAAECQSGERSAAALAQTLSRSMVTSTQLDHIERLSAELGSG